MCNYIYIYVGYVRERMVCAINVFIFDDKDFLKAYVKLHSKHPVINTY